MLRTKTSNFAKTLTGRLAATVGAAAIAATAIAAGTVFADGPQDAGAGDEQVTAASRAVDELSLPSVTAAGAEIVEASEPTSTPDAPDLAERTASEPAAEESQAATDVLTGEASWYGPGFAGQATASGETYDPGAMTAAHKSLPLGTTVRVTNEHNDATVTVRINDRGPYSGGRIIDVSSAAADQLGMKGSGVVPVTVEVLG